MIIFPTDSHEGSIMNSSIEWTKALLSVGMRRRSLEENNYLGIMENSYFPIVSLRDWVILGRA